MNSLAHALIAGIPKTSDRAALIAAHDAAEEFHAAMARALRYERDLEDDKKLAAGSKTDWSDIIAEEERGYRDAISDAVAAVRNMPVAWCEVLRIKLENAASQKTSVRVAAAALGQGHGGPEADQPAARPHSHDRESAHAPEGIDHGAGAHELPHPAGLADAAGFNATPAATTRT